MRKVTLLLIAVCCYITTSAQYNYYRFNFGFGAGVTRGYADLKEKQYQPAIYTSLDYHLTPFVTVGLEYQNGKISGGDSIRNSGKRYFKNSYSAFIANGKVQLGQIIDFERNEKTNAFKP